MPEKTCVVAQGDCILSIAAKEGVPWKRIWDYGRNRELRELRKDPNLLLPGDVVVVPEKDVHVVECSTGRIHRFVVRRPTVEVRVRIYRLDLPRKNEPYHVEINGQVYKGDTDTTDDEGLAVCRVPAATTRAELVIGEDREIFELYLGHLDPHDTVSGLHGILENYGFDTGGVDSPWDETSASAMSQFLMQHGGEELTPGDLADHADATNADALLAAYRDSRLNGQG